MQCKINNIGEGRSKVVIFEESKKAKDLRYFKSHWRG